MGRVPICACLGLHAFEGGIFFNKEQLTFYIFIFSVSMSPCLLHGRHLSSLLTSQDGR